MACKIIIEAVSLCELKHTNWPSLFLCLKYGRKEKIAMKKRCGNLVRDAPKA